MGDWVLPLSKLRVVGIDVSVDGGSGFWGLGTVDANDCGEENCCWNTVLDEVGYSEIVSGRICTDPAVNGL